MWKNRDSLLFWYIVKEKKKKKKEKELRLTGVIVCITLLNLPTKVLMDARDEIFSSVSLLTNYNMSLLLKESLKEYFFLLSENSSIISDRIFSFRNFQRIFSITVMIGNYKRNMLPH